VLTADPSLEVAVAEVRAHGHHGETLETARRQPVAGVSGTEMVEAIMGSIPQASSHVSGTVVV
jgi:aspartate dehydrogenase